MDLATAGIALLEMIIKLVTNAIAGDTRAQARLRRVEEVLKDSPTERAWARAMDIAAAKSRAFDRPFVEVARDRAFDRPDTIPPPPPNPFDEGDP